jgi:hypothetical protein
MVSKKLYPLDCFSLEKNNVMHHLKCRLRPQSLEPALDPNGGSRGKDAIWAAWDSTPTQNKELTRIALEKLLEDLFLTTYQTTSS